MQLDRTRLDRPTRGVDDLVRARPRLVIADENFVPGARSGGILVAAEGLDRGYLSLNAEPGLVSHPRCAVSRHEIAQSGSGDPETPASMRKRPPACG